MTNSKKSDGRNKQTIGGRGPESVEIECQRVHA